MNDFDAALEGVKGAMPGVGSAKIGGLLASPPAGALGSIGGGLFEDRHMRMRCLELIWTSRNYSGTAQDAIGDARKLYDFVMGTKGDAA